MNSAAEFARLYAAARALEAGGFRRPAAFATILRTRGSTYRHAGASMLVRSGGSVVCPLAGGCPQHDLVLRARRVMRDDRAQLAAYSGETGLDLLIEAGCGGELEVLLEPLSRPGDLAFLDAMARLHRQRACGTLATLFARDGEILPRPRRLLWSDALEWQDIDVAPLAERIRGICADPGACRRPQIRRVACDGASTEVLLERLEPVHRVLVFGVNPGALALARIAEALGWQVLLIDSAGEGARGVTFVRTSPRDLHAHVTFDRFTSAVVTTHNLERDAAWLRALDHVPLAFLGVVGSRGRAARIRAALPGVGQRLHCPAGLDLGAETPEEIALSVIGEILAVSKRHGLDSLAPAGVSVVA